MVSLIILVSTALVGFDYHRARNSAIEDAKSEMRIFSDRLVDRFGVLSGQTVAFVDVIASVANAFLVPPPERLDDKIALLREFISRSEPVDGAYAGYPDGSFFHLVNLKTEGWRTALGAPKDAALAVRVIDADPDGNRQQRLIFLDSAETVVGEAPTTAIDFDPRTRPWYKAAAGIEPAVSIGPYQMATTGKLGVTVAESHTSGNPVIIPIARS